MTDSILAATKETLGISGQTAFDPEVTTFINSALGTLSQLGVGPADGFAITGSSEIWSDFVGTNKLLNPIQTYVHLRVRMLFDPPQIGFVITAMKDQIKELESRINYLVDDEIPTTTPVEEEV